MRLKPELKGALLTLLCIALILIGVWIYVGVRFGIWMPNEYGRFVELTVNLPVAEKLWTGQIKAGDDAEQLIKDWRPHELTRYGAWIEMRWFPGGPSPEGTISFVGIYVLAKNGKLVLASSYADDGLDERIFFNSITPTDEIEQRTALEEYVDKIRAEREKTIGMQTNQPTAESVH